MNKIQVRLYDNNVAHTYPMFGYYTFTGNKQPKSITYVKDVKSESGISVFTDDFLDLNIIREDDSKWKVAFLVESKLLRPLPYIKIHEVAHLFDLIVSHDLETVNSFNNAVFCPYGGSWVTEDELNHIWRKEHLISCIASKNTDTEGHLLRHWLIYIFSHRYKWHLWGKGYKPFKSKVDPLAKYMYSVAIQNGRYNTYFTEILVDPFLLRTIPIFWGAPDIGKIFNSKGFYTFESVSDLNLILNKISRDDYESKLDYVNENYEIAMTMRNSDELLHSAIRKNLF